MTKKSWILLEVLIVIGLFIWYTKTELIPELKKEYGSSDTILNTRYYQNMIEIMIDDDVDFAIIINEQKQIYHMFFFEEKGTCLYNQNIERQSLEFSINQIIKRLIKNNSIKTDTKISLIRYEEDYYEEIKKEIIKNLENNKINYTLEEQKKDLLEKAKELSINTENPSNILTEMDYYSKSITGIGKKNKKEINYQSLANATYQKLEEYVGRNGIKNLTKEEVEVPLSFIPTDSSLKVYPTENSWYYVKEGKVYAYIEIEEEGYCFDGDVISIRKGECTNE